jgi:glucose-6-phosphate dehydrogenase assembly protein OpcA
VKSFPSSVLSLEFRLMRFSLMPHGAKPVSSTWTRCAKFTATRPSRAVVPVICGWTFGQAEDARSNEDLAHRFIVRCRETSTILPAVSTIERLCADALVAAERRIETRIAENLTADVRDHLDKLLSEMLAGNISRFIWLRNFEVGNNSAAANRLLDRLEFLRTLNINHSALASIPAHRIARLRRQGERYFTDGLRDITSTAAGRSLPSVLWSGKRRLLMP